MTFNMELTQSYLTLLREETLPAIGCTEPVAVALCAAEASACLLKEPYRLHLEVSPYILKNGMHVGIPGTAGLTGLDLACALGSLLPHPEKQMTILGDVSDEKLSKATFEGYIEVGRELLEKSDGKVKLSYVDPGSYTWRYWFRRGLMPQANARIWDENGNVAFDKDPGTRLAMETFNTLLSEGMLLNVGIFSTEQYEAARRGELATYYIESFWDTFLRGNLQDMSGSWRCMPAPVFEEIGTAGAQVIAMYCPINTGNEEKTKLFVDMLLDFNLNAAERNQWTEDMLAMDYATEHPITKELQADPYWLEASDFYGGQSYRQMVTASFENPSANLEVNLNDAEADSIISSEIEKWVAGSQDMEATISAIGEQLRIRLNLQ